MLDFLLDSPQYVSRNVLGLRFCIEDQKPDFASGEPIEVEDAHTASLATTSYAPAHLAHTTRTRNDFAGLWIGRDERHEGTTFLLGPVVVGEPLKEGRFDDRVHGLNYTAKPYVASTTSLRPVRARLLIRSAFARRPVHFAGR